MAIISNTEIAANATLINIYSHPEMDQQQCLTQFTEKTIMKQAVQEATTICPRPLQVNLLPFDLESGVRVTCDMGFLCANIVFLGPIYVTDRHQMRIIA